MANILICDDDKEIVDAIEIYLKNEGYKVYKAYDGEEAIRILNNPKASKMRILVLTRTVKDALKVRQSVGEIGFLNVGNTGRFDGIDVSEKLVLTPTIMLTKAEQQALKDLVALEPKTCMQQVPNDEQKLVKDVLDKLN